MGCDSLNFLYFIKSPFQIMPSMSSEQALLLLLDREVKALKARQEVLEQKNLELQELNEVFASALQQQEERLNNLYERCNRNVRLGKLKFSVLNLYPLF